MPLPNAEPIGLPAPAWLLLSLLVLTFSLHLIPMTLTVGGTLLALWHEVLARVRGAGAGGHHRRMASQLWGMLPTITAFTITLGVAPLLFVQLVYGKFFYPASILTGWSWFAVVPLLIVGYGGLYLQAMGNPTARWRPWVGLASLVAFVAVAATYVSTMSLTTAPEEWKALYAASQGGTHWHFQLARGLHVLLGALAMAGGLVGLIGHTAADDAVYSRFARRCGLIWAGAALVLQAPVSLWYLGTLPEAGSAAVSLWLVIPAGALALVGFLALLLAERTGRSALAGWTAMGALSLGAAALAVQRHLVRQATLAPHIDVAADWKLQPQWDVFTIFAILLVATLLLLGYLGVRFLRATQATAAGMARSAD